MDKIKIGEYKEFENQWNLYRLNVPACWEYASGEGVVVGVVDSGVDGSHKDLGWEGLQIREDIVNLSYEGQQAAYNYVNAIIWKGEHPKILPGWNFITDNDNCCPTNQHGTYMAGAIAADIGDGFGMVGVAPHCKIRPYVVWSPTMSVAHNAIAEGIKRAADDGCDVINVSLTSPYREPICEAVGYAADKGSIVVAAMGNYYAAFSYYPAACFGSLAVGGCDPTGKRWLFSGKWGSTAGKHIICLAPGSDQVATFWWQSRFTPVMGTSSAAACMSGVCALLKSLDKALTVHDIIEMIAEFSNEEWTEERGWGVPDVLKLVKSLVVEKPVVIEPNKLQGYVDIIDDCANNAQIIEEALRRLALRMAVINDV